MEFKPHAYQQRAIDTIINTPRCGLFLDMGLGKTVITLTAIRELMFNSFDVSKVLIIAPLKVAESTWSGELEKWSHLKDIKMSLVLGDLAKRVKALKEYAHIYVINRDNVKWLTHYLGRDFDFDMVVLDELTSFKNPTSIRFRALKRYISKCIRVVGLTGTPSPNSLMDLWSQMYLIDGGVRLGKTLTEYRNTYFYPVKYINGVAVKYELKPGCEEEIRDKISDICVSMSAEDYLELPDKILIEHKLNISRKEVYDALEREYYYDFLSSEVNAVSKAALINKLLQVCNGAVYTSKNEYEHIHDVKLDSLGEILEGAQGKAVLCFYNYKHDLKRIRERFPYAVELSEDTLKAWSEGKIKLLLAHPSSSAYGLNLQAGGHTIVWFGLPWSLELYEQANARLYRQGQSSTVYIHHLVCKDTVDMQVLASLSRKKDVQDSLIKHLGDKYRGAI